MLDVKRLMDYLEQENRKGQLDGHMKILEDFQTFLADRSIKSERDITSKDINDYVSERREQAKDINHTIEVLNEYFYAVNNDVLSNETWNLCDAIWIFKKMSELTKNELGEDIWQKVFGGIPMPEIGWTLDEITDFTRQMHKRISKAASQEQIENMVQKHAHGVDGYEQSVDGALREILESKGIDGLIKHLNDSIIKEAEECRDKGVLWWATIVDDDVINYFKENPMNYRTGNKIINKQGPSLTQKFLHETDEKLKRYYGCHCPIKKKSILQDEGSLSHSLCYCCFGHNKQQFEGAFGRELTGRVIRTRMDEGCLECVFEIDIPDEFIEENL
jgi:hypothetical protein